MKGAYRRRWHFAAFFCALSIAGMAPLAACAGPRATTVEPQQIQLVMQPASQGGQSVADYSRVLAAGEEVTGNVNVSGEWEIPSDYCSPWTYEVSDPDGTLIDSATIQIIPYAADNPYYYFVFTAAIAGKYVIRIIHYSPLTRYLAIVVSPPGWQYQLFTTSSADASSPVISN